MIVTCPNCETQFNLADELYVPGRKARCSVCSFVFILPALAAPGIPAAAPAGASDAEHVSLDKMDTSGSPDLESILAAEESEYEAEKAVDQPLPRELGDIEDYDARLKAMQKTKNKQGGCLKRLFLLLALFICLGGLGAGVYVIYFQGQIKLPFALPFELPFEIPGVVTKTGDGEQSDPVAGRIANIDKVKDLLLIDVQHRYVQNVKLGPLVVITGKVRNNFSTPKEMIRVEASLLDKKGKALATQHQYCGVVVPDLQLQVLGQKELAQALDNRFDILANNINVQPGVEIPFMVVFVYPPSNMAEYTVVVSDVSDPPDLTPKSDATAVPAGQ